MNANVDTAAGAAPSVSVVIPTYNRARTIVEAAASVLRQTVSDIEVIVSDDGSTDDTRARLDRIGDPRLRVLSDGANRGANAARNAGWRAARGRWVAFQDSDDEWLPRKLEKQLDRLAAAGPDCVGVYCGMIVLGDGVGRTDPGYVPAPGLGGVDGDILPALLADSFVSTQTLVARRDALERVGGFDESLPALQDWDCVLRLARLGPIALVDEPLVIQRHSADGITRSAAKRVAARTRIVEKNLDLLRARPALLADHYRAIAGGHRRLGDSAAARAWLLRALRLRPADPALWALTARSLIG